MAIHKARRDNGTGKVKARNRSRDLPSQLGAPPDLSNDSVMPPDGIPEEGRIESDNRSGAEEARREARGKEHA
jgi:hypothetical protein